MVLTLFDLHRSILTKRSDDGERYRLIKQTFHQTLNQLQLQTTTPTLTMATPAGNGTGNGNAIAAVIPATQHENVLFTTNTLPGTDTNIGNIIATTPIEEQRQRAIDLYSFLTSENRQLSQLNADNVPRTAVIGIPGSELVKIVYGTGFGVSAIGQTSPIDSKILLLHGDGGPDIGTPQPVVIPLESITENNVGVMTDEQFTFTLTVKGPEFLHPLLARNRILDTKPILQLAPIPTYLVYDGLNQDLNAALILERLMTVETDGIDMYMHLRHMLLACLSSHNQNQPKPYIAQQFLLAPPSIPARRWASEKFKTIFPTLNPNPVQAANPGQNNGDLAAILAQLLPLQQQALQIQLDRTNRGGHNEEKKDDESITLGMSNQELASTLIMCGKNPHDHHTLLPQWFQDCAEKGMTESFRLRIIRKHIMLHVKYDDADIPITATLLKNINKRNWLGKEGNIKRPSLLNASEGLSPFIVLDLDEDEVARLNDTDDALTRASTVTMQDIANLKKKLSPKIPQTADEFMLLLKRFANLLFALFSEECPFFKCIVKIINAMKEFSRTARDTMTVTTRASILWIILLQSRNFALGEDTILAEFTAMHTNLASKQGNIFHAEVPQALISPTTSILKRKQPIQDQDATKQQEIKKPRQNLNNWHPVLKAKLAGPLLKANYPSYTQIMQYVDKDPSEVISDKSSWCTPNAFFGRCFFGEKCKRQHKMVNDGQADKILQMMEKFIASPEELKTKG